MKRCRGAGPAGGCRPTRNGRKPAGSDDGRRFPWGEEWPGADANFDMMVGRTFAGWLFPQGVSPYGCHDMAGNVNDWVDDWFWPEFGLLVNSPQTPPHLTDALRIGSMWLPLRTKSIAAVVLRRLAWITKCLVTRREHGWPKRRHGTGFARPWSGTGRSCWKVRNDAPP